VPRVDTAIDCGFAANPERICSQIEGAAVMGMSLALYGENLFFTNEPHGYDVWLQPPALARVRGSSSKTVLRICTFFLLSLVDHCTDSGC
jgi:Molybdopterin-binding domain of aldehyde dehydrogenase